MADAAPVNVQRDFVDNLFNISGRVAIVTGATGALGGAIAVAYAMSGAKVVLTGRNANKLEAVAKQITDVGGICTTVAADPSSAEDFAKVIETAKTTPSSSGPPCPAAPSRPTPRCSATTT